MFKEAKNNFFQNKYVFLVLIIFLILTYYLLPVRVDLPWNYIIISLVVLLILMLSINLRDSKKIAQNAFVIIFFIGSLNSLILPAGSGLDEQSHYSRAMQIADGRFFNSVSKEDFYQVSNDYAFNPEGQINKYNLNSQEWLELKHQPSDYSGFERVSKSLFNPVFLPSAIGIKIGQLISPYVYVAYYLGRIFNVLAFALLAYIAIRKSKRYKIALFSTATVPFALWIPAGYNYDSFYFGLTLMVVSILVNMFNETYDIKIKDVLLYSICCGLLVLAKAPVVALIILPLFIPIKYFHDKTTKLHSLIPIILSTFCAFIWLAQGSVKELLKKIFGVATMPVVNSSSSQPSILGQFLSDIGYTFDVFIRTFFDVIGSELFGQIKTPNGHFSPMFVPFDHKISENINMIIFILTLLLVSFVIQVSIPNLFKIVLLGISSFIILAMIYAISGDSRVFQFGNDLIAGLQGRYLFFLILFVPLLLSPYIKKMFHFADNELKLSGDYLTFANSLIIKLCLFGALSTSFIYMFTTGFLNY